MASLPASSCTRRACSAARPEIEGRAPAVGGPSRYQGSPATMNSMTQPNPATATFRAARDLLLRHREDHRRGDPRVLLAGAGRVQLGAGLVRRGRGRAPGPGGAAGRRRGRHHVDDLRRAGGQIEPGGQLAALARRPARRPAAAHARQHRPAVGGHPRRDQARRGDHPGQHAAQPRGPGRPHRPGRGPARGDRDRTKDKFAGLPATGPASWSSPARSKAGSPPGGPTGGSATPSRSACRPNSPRTG